MSALLPLVKRSAPQIPDEILQEFHAELTRGIAEELVELTIPIYEEHLTHAEIKELIRFYETAVGRKLIQVMPDLIRESMEVGQRWGLVKGQKIVERMFEKLRERGYTVNPKTS